MILASVKTRGTTSDLEDCVGANGLVHAALEEDTPQWCRKSQSRVYAWMHL